MMDRRAGERRDSQSAEGRDRLVPSLLRYENLMVVTSTYATCYIYVSNSGTHTTYMGTCRHQDHLSTVPVTTFRVALWFWSSE